MGEYLISNYVIPLVTVNNDDLFLDLRVIIQEEISAYV